MSFSPVWLEVDGFHWFSFFLFTGAVYFCQLAPMGSRLSKRCLSQTNGSSLRSRFEVSPKVSPRAIHAWIFSMGFSTCGNMRVPCQFTRTPFLFDCVFEQFAKSRQLKIGYMFGRFGVFLPVISRGSKPQVVLLWANSQKWWGAGAASKSCV